MPAVAEMYRKPSSLRPDLAVGESMLVIPAILSPIVDGLSIIGESCRESDMIAIIIIRQEELVA